MRNKLCLVSVLALCSMPQLSMAAPIIYTGSLSTVDGGLVATSTWAPATLSWEVRNDLVQGRWYYEYTLTVPQALQDSLVVRKGAVKPPALSHVIIEVSDGDPGPAFTIDNLFSPGANPVGWIGETEIGDYSVDNGNPSMPGTMYGVKFGAAAEFDDHLLTVSFYSDRVPVWGDFYAKGGSASAVYNAGFAAPDPTAAPHLGPEQCHLLVPDTMTVPTIPAPGAVLLATIGAGLVGRLKRRGAL